MAMMSAWGLRVNWRDEGVDGKACWYFSGPGPGSFSLVLPERKPLQPRLILDFYKTFYWRRKITVRHFLFSFLASITFYFLNIICTNFISLQSVLFSNSEVLLKIFTSRNSPNIFFQYHGLSCFLFPPTKFNCQKLSFEGNVNTLEIKTNRMKKRDSNVINIRSLIWIVMLGHILTLNDPQEVILIEEKTC